MKKQKKFDKLKAFLEEKVGRENFEDLGGLTVLGSENPIDGSDAVTVVVGDRQQGGIGIIYDDLNSFNPNDVGSLVLVPLDQVDAFKAAIDKAVEHQRSLGVQL